MKKTKKTAPKRKGTSTALVTKTIGLPEKVSAGISAIAAVDPQALLVQAIDKNLPIESMERLLAMRDKMKAEWAREQFFLAFSGFQKDCPIIGKQKVAKGKNFSYNYAPLEDIVVEVQPVMERWGFSWTCKPSQTDGHVRAVVHVHHKDGHEEVTEFEVPLDPASYMSDPQKAAAALTFARRYAFINAFGITTKGEDNDAQREEEPRRAPISQPQARKDEPVPVQHEEKHEEVTVYNRILWTLKATATDPKTKQIVVLFNSNEIIDYTSQANQSKDNPAELAVILADVTATAKKKTRVVKGELV
jgi:hypothetical protein